MFTALTDFARLTKAFWVLSRWDALVPKEFAAGLPLPLRLFGHVSRLGARGKKLRPGQRLAKALGGQGPAYIKFGQLLATRPDIIGFEMAADLGELQDRMAPFSQKEAEAEIARALGKPVHDLFASFSECIAAASIAQVHKATLQDGRNVAVKVLRPNIELVAKREFRAFTRGAKLIEFFSKSARRMEPVKFLNTLKDAADIELDLRMEAGAASELKENLAFDTRIYIPEIHWEYSTRRVMTLEWIEGLPVTDFERLKASGINREDLAALIMQTFLHTAVNDGYFHADMHQGNLLIDDQNRLVLIDFGIMGRLDAHSRRVFADIIYGFIQRDYYHAAKAHFDAGYIPAHYSIDAFATALRAVGEPIFGRDSDDVDMSRVLQQLFDVTEIFDMHLRPELVLLQRTMVIVEGVARALHPSINMWQTADPVIREYIAGEIGPEAFFKKAKGSADAALRLAGEFPEFAAAAERAVQFVGEDGIRLSSDTVDELADALRRRRKVKPKAG